MSFGKTPRRRPERVGLLGSLLPLLWLSSPVLAVPPDGLRELMAQLGEVRSVSARYTESIRMSLLEHSIERTGTIRYISPDTILLSADAETRREIRIAGNRISIREAGQTQDVEVAEHQAIASMVAALRSVFSGDLEDLERHFRVGFERIGSKEDDEGWRLTLDPNDAEVAWLLSRIEIQGIGREIRRIAIREPNGDSRTVRIESEAIDAPDP
jgi:hypothetical protein